MGNLKRWFVECGVQYFLYNLNISEINVAFQTPSFLLKQNNNNLVGNHHYHILKDSYHMYEQQMIA